MLYLRRLLNKEVFFGYANGRKDSDMMKILITGARSNIGYDLALSLAKRGHIVYAGCKNYKEKKTLEEKINSNKIIMFPIVVNLLSDNFNIINTLDLDSLILHASIGNGGSILEVSNERFNEVIDVNIKGNFRLLQTYVRYCYYKNKRGKIFLTSSLAAFYPFPYLSTYTSSKIYLINMLKTLRLECLYQNIEVNTSLILPGAYHTGFNELMIENKDKDGYILKEKAITMTKYQKIAFSFLEKLDYDDLIKKIVKEIEKDKPKFIISRPLLQKTSTKIYILAKLLSNF